MKIIQIAISNNTLIVLTDEGKLLATNLLGKHDEYGNFDEYEFREIKLK